MKKIFILFILLLSPVMVSASTCSASDKASLLTLSSVVSINYEEMTGYYTEDELGDVEGYDEENTDELDWSYNYFNINLLNLTEDFYAVITNNVNDTKLTVNYSDTSDKIYTFMHETLSEVTSYTIKIYASSNTNCEDTVLTTLYLVVPKYNRFSTLGLCTGNEDAAVCQKYTTVTTYTESYVLEKLISGSTVEESEDLEENENSVFEFFESNYVYVLYVIAGGIIIGVLVVFIKRKRSDLK